jgi:hypothetical protein
MKIIHTGADSLTISDDPDRRCCLLRTSDEALTPEDLARVEALKRFVEQDPPTLWQHLERDDSEP